MKFANKRVWLSSTDISRAYQNRICKGLGVELCLYCPVWFCISKHNPGWDVEVYEDFVFLAKKNTYGDPIIVPTTPSINKATKIYDKHLSRCLKPLKITIPVEA